MIDVALFSIFSLIAIGAAVNLVVQRHPISSALSLVAVMVALAAMYLHMGGEFIAAAQIIVYAGAIMVLFVFVIMLLNAGAEKRGSKARFAKFFGIPLFVFFTGMMSYILQMSMPRAEHVVFGKFQKASAQEVGLELFTRHLLPFEVTSVLILIAILGAVVLARKEI